MTAKLVDGAISAVFDNEGGFDRGLCADFISGEIFVAEQLVASGHSFVKCSPPSIMMNCLVFPVVT